MLNSFHLNDHTLGFHPQNHLVQHNKQYHRKVLLSSFHLNGHTLGFDPPTQKLQPPCTAEKTVPQESTPEYVVATGLGNGQGKNNSARSGKCQGILFWGRENWHFEEKSGKIEIVTLI